MISGKWILIASSIYWFYVFSLIDLLILMKLINLYCLFTYEFYLWLQLKGCSMHLIYSMIKEIDQPAPSFNSNFILNPFNLRNDNDQSDLNQNFKSLSCLFFIIRFNFIFIKHHFKYRWLLKNWLIAINGEQFEYSILSTNACFIYEELQICLFQ